MARCKEHQEELWLGLEARKLRIGGIIFSVTLASAADEC